MHPPGGGRQLDPGDVTGPWRPGAVSRTSYPQVMRVRTVAVAVSLITLTLVPAVDGAKNGGGTGIQPYLLSTPLSQFTAAQLGEDHTRFYPRLKGQIFESEAPMAWGPITVDTRRLLQFLDGQLAMAHFDVDSVRMASTLQTDNIVRVARVMRETALKLSGDSTPKVSNEFTAESVERRWTGPLLIIAAPTAGWSVYAVRDGGPVGTTVSLTYSLKTRK